MTTKGERGKATDFSIAAIMAPRGPSFGHYHLQGISNVSNNSLECKEYDASPGLDYRELIIHIFTTLIYIRRSISIFIFIPRYNNDHYVIYNCCFFF